MSPPPKPRKRAVCLTAQALDDLQRALSTRWQEDQRAGKLTREAQAELMGVSVATAKNMLSGAGADRASFALAFKRLGLAWSDACYDSLVQAPELVAPKPEAAPAPAATAKTWRPASIAAALAVAVAGTSFVNWYRDRQWKVESSDTAIQGHALYEQARYNEAVRHAERAFAIAKAHDSADLMAHSTHVLGEVAGARGRLRTAKACFERELALRRLMSSAIHFPVILEALGDVETRLGDYSSARQHLTAAMEDYRLNGDPIGIALVQRDLGSVALGIGDLHAADDWLRQSLLGVRGTGRPSIEADIRDRQALVLLARGRAAEAKPLFRTCLDYWKSQGHARWIALSELHLGRATAELEDPSARTWIARSRDDFARVGDEARVAEADADLRRLASRESQRDLPERIAKS